MTVFREAKKYLSKGMALYPLFLLFACQSTDHSIKEAVGSAQPLPEKEASAYSWMESDSDRLKEWLKQQQKTTDSEFSKLANFEKLRKSIDGRVASAPGFSDIKPTTTGIYFLYRAPGADSASLCFLENGKKEFKVILKAGQPPWSQEGSNLSYFFPSPSGRYVVYGITEGGSEKARLHIFDREQNKTLDESIDKTQYPFVRFLNDDTGFAYARHDDMDDKDPSKRLKNTRVRLHRYGTSMTADPVVLGSEIQADQAFSSDDFYRIRFLKNSGVAVALATKGTSAPFRFYYKPMKDLESSGSPWREFISEADDVQEFTFDLERAYILNTKEQQRTRIEMIDFTDNNIARTTLWASDDSKVIKIEAAADGLYAIVNRNLDTKVLRIDPKTKKVVEFTPEGGTSFTDIVGAAGREGVVVELSSFLSPVLYADVKPKIGLKVIEGVSVRVEDTPLEWVVDYAKSHDGVMIPMYIIKQKGRQLGPDTPVLMRSYAAYGMVTKPSFDRTSNEWIERGGIRVFCLARGGGELGAEWHKAGQRRNKLNSVLDTVACTEHLFKKGISNPRKMAFFSGSAGGIIAGALVNLRPDLYAAVVVDVGMLNLTRNQFRPGGASNISEYGDMSDAGDAAVMRSLDAVENIKSSPVRPAVLCTHGYNDSRVPIWMSAKFVARLQAEGGGKRPVLMRTNFEAGHGFVSTRKDRTYLWADIYTFLMWQLDVT